MFIYLGDLRPALSAAYTALRPGGLLAFTTESFSGPDDFRLLPTRRYAQSGPYIGRLAAEIGFTRAAVREAALRRGEENRPVTGEVHLLGKPAG